MDTTNIIEFQSDIEAFAHAVRVNTGVAMKSIVDDIAERVINGTPVDTGRARDNWNETLDAPSDDYDPHPELKHGDAIKPHAQPDLQIDGTRPVFITNNTPYILFLENGSSKQAPAGMAQLAVTVVEERVDQVIKEGFFNGG